MHTAKFKLFPKLLIIIGILLFAGCSSSGLFKSKRKIDVKVVRFDQELFDLNIYYSSTGIKELTGKYPKFMPLFSNRIIEIGDTSEPWFASAMQKFVTDQAIYNIHKQVSKVFPDFEKQTNELSDGFSQYKSMFPVKAIPTIYTYISGFNQSIVTADSILGISLEKYLGKDDSLYYELYPPLPQYQRYRMTPENIASDALKSWITTEFEYNPKQNNLLAKMLYGGRTLFILKKIYDEKPDTLLWNFTSKQMKFCLDNEKRMWTYLIEQKLLFINDNLRVIQFTEEGPFTKDFSTDSPGQAAIWVGYRIIEKYYKRVNPSMQQLMEENDFQKILNESRYNP
jgi:hypothetical protein